MFIPLYMLFRIGEDILGKEPYLLGKFGYGFFQGNSEYFVKSSLIDEGGFFYCLGLGRNITDNINVELFYSTNRAIGKSRNEDKNKDKDDLSINYSKITFSIGFIFGDLSESKWLEDLTNTIKKTK